MKALAVICWLLAWTCSGLIVAALFAARARKPDLALAEAATGLLGAAGFALIGAYLW